MVSFTPERLCQIWNQPIKKFLPKKFPPGGRYIKRVSGRSRLNNDSLIVHTHAIIVIMRIFKMRRKTPYWNMWRVILTYWIARHPKVVLTALGVLIVVLYNSVSN